MRGIEATPGNTMTLARFMAERAVKAQWQAQGIKIAYVDPRELANAAGHISTPIPSWLSKPSPGCVWKKGSRIDRQQSPVLWGLLRRVINAN
jgi:hypothetical protein